MEMKIIKGIYLGVLFWVAYQCAGVLAVMIALVLGIRI